MTLAGANSYTGGTIVNGGTLNLTGSITGDLAVGPNATFVNSGTVNSPGYWLSNQGTFINSGTIAGNSSPMSRAPRTPGPLLDPSSTAALARSSITAPSVATFLNMGMLSGNGTIGGSFFNTGVMAPGNSIGTINVAGNFVNAANGTYLAEVVGRPERPHHGRRLGPPARRHGRRLGPARPRLRAQHSVHPASAAGGLSGTFGSVNSSIPSCSRT